MKRVCGQHGGETPLYDAIDSSVYRELPSLNTPFAASSKGGFSGSLFLTSPSDTDCILAFTLGLSVPTLKRFCNLKSTIYDII